MEETQNQPQETFGQNQEPQNGGVSFPNVPSQKKGNGAKTLLIVGILVLVGILGYVIYRSASKTEEDTNLLTEPTPYENMIAPNTEPTIEPVASPSSTPAAADKSEIKIQVQNGTGITGEAAFLQTILEGLGYEDIAVGNSAAQDAEDTTVSFTSAVPASIVTEITNKLNATYEKVTKTSSTSSTYDVVIVTGLKKGATPKPTTTPTATPAE